MTPATATEDKIQSPLAHLSEEQIEELAKEFDAIHDDVYSDLGEHDRRYITAMIEFHRRLAVMSRVALLGADFKPAWVLGTVTNSTAKILENMEIGHNVMHGQWDWMNDPQIHSSTWDWDTASTAEAWKHSHNYVHHTFTNIRGKDKDLGYEIMRIDPNQKWHPVYLFQPLYNLVLMAPLRVGRRLPRHGPRGPSRGREVARRTSSTTSRASAVKARDQIVKDYVGWPAISALAAGATDFVVRRDKDKALKRARDTFKKAAVANATANVVRNLWSHAIIFCGHFPDQTYTFSQEETEDESRGAWYVRQLTGAANIEGGPFFHVMSGNLGYQVEHHLFPDMPSSRYAQIAPRVKDICERYELPYNTGPFFQQWGMVNRTIVRLAFPGGTARPKPGPVQGRRRIPAAEHERGEPERRQRQRGRQGARAGACVQGVVRGRARADRRRRKVDPPERDE